MPQSMFCERYNEWVRHTGVVLVERNAELAQTREQLRLDLAVHRVVDALVYRRLDVPVCLADSYNFNHLPAGQNRYE